jgi:hypothetical protein
MCYRQTRILAVMWRLLLPIRLVPDVPDLVEMVYVAGRQGMQTKGRACK